MFFNFQQNSSYLKKFFKYVFIEYWNIGNKIYEPVFNKYRKKTRFFRIQVYI